MTFAHFGATMRRLINSGLMMRVAMVVANAWLMGGLTEVIDYPGGLMGRVDILSFTIFGAAFILGSALVTQKSLEHFENRGLGSRVGHARQSALIARADVL